MATTTPAEIQVTIMAALGNRAERCRSYASGRRMSRPENAGRRAAFRAEAKLCEDLRRIIGHVDPGKLAIALEADR